MRATVSIDEMFMRAVEMLDLGERARYLDSVCSGDADLREQVEKLLTLAPRLGGFLETPVATPMELDTKPDVEMVDLSGQSIGPYRLIRLAGSGGMGEVYLAEQQTPIQRQVAIKVIRSGLATAPTLARFAHESHLLGLMDHPNIARVLDAGTTPSRNPFIAMEWVEGVHITTFCDQQRYTIRQRVELLVLVCQAVQHAHQKGIIHRDLKPSNVLVTIKDEKAVAKVIDFGVARATHLDQAQTERVTQTGQIIGTFEYMAPEQADARNANDIDTRSDVFSLGALLYELLTGVSPTPQEEFRTAGLGERLRLIREVEPVRPSHRYTVLGNVESIAANRQTGVSQLSRLVANELDWICLKCLEKDRTRRYETTNALAQDLLRYLSGEPVQAGPPTLAYRIRKFAARNRTLLAAASVLGFLLLGAAVFSTWQAVRLASLHEQSQTNLLAANSNLELAISAVEEFCTKVNEDLRLKDQDLRPLRKELMSSAVKFHQQLVELRSRSGAARIDLARSHAKLGQLALEIESIEAANASLRLAIDEYRALAVDRPSSQTNRTAEQIEDFELAKCYYFLALLLGRSNDPAAGELAALEAVGILERLLDAEPTLHLARSSLANVRTLQASLANDTQRFEESEEFARMAIDELGFLSNLKPEDPTLLTNLAYARWQLGSGIFQRSLSRWREAEPLLLEALTMVRHAASLDRNTTYHDLRQAEILRTLGQISKVTGRREAGSNYLTEAIALLETIRLKEPSVQSHAIQLAGLNTDFSLIQALGGDLIGQRSSLERAIELLEPLVDNPTAQLHLAVATGQLARLMFKEDNLDLSEILLDRAIGLAEKVLQRSPDDRQLATSYPGMLKDRANVRIRLGRLEEALHDYDRAVDVESVAMRAPTRIARGRLHKRLGNHRQALTEVRETIAELPSATPAHVWIFVLKSGAQLCVECSVAVDSDEELSVQEKTALAEEYAAIAVGLLGQAVQKGFEESDFLSTHPEFESLRNRTDFQALGL